MSLSVIWKLLDAAKVDIGADIAGDGPGYVNPFKRLAGNMNALYEYMFDVAAPGQGGAQTYEGHDHGLIGPPITRGVVFSMDWGQSALINFTPAGNNWNTWRTIGADNAQGFDRPFLYEVSPRIPVPSVLEAWIHYGCNVDFDLRMVEQNTNENLAQGRNFYALKALGAGESSRWERLPYVPANPGEINYLNMMLRAKAYDAATPPLFSLFALVIAETPATTLPPDGSISL